MKRCIPLNKGYKAEIMKHTKNPELTFVAESCVSGKMAVEV